MINFSEFIDLLVFGVDDLFGFFELSFKLVDDKLETLFRVLELF